MIQKINQETQLKNNKRKIIGSSGFETKITKNNEGKLIRIYNSQNYFYKKKSKSPAMTKSYLTYIYFDKNEKPDFAKITYQEIIKENIIISDTKFYDIEDIDYNNFNKKIIYDLLNELKNKNSLH